MQTTSVLLVPATFNGKLIDCLNEIMAEFGRKNVNLKEPNENEAFRLFELRDLWQEDKDLIQNICARFEILPIFITGENSLNALLDKAELTLCL